MSSFFTVLNQVGVLFLLMGLGYTLSKLGIINEDCSSRLTTILCYVICPCIIFYSFQLKYTQEMWNDIIFMGVIAFIILGALILIFHLLYNKHVVKDDEKRATLRFASIYPNTGFMGFPLLEAFCGTQGLFYGSIFTGVLNIFVWSHGYTLYYGKVTKESIRKAVLNPSIIAVILGIICFRFSIILPDPFYTTVKYVAELNTPLSMIIIGTTLTKVPFKKIFTSLPVWVGVAFKNLIAPIAVMFTLHLFGISGLKLSCLTILVSCPVAGLTVIFPKLNKKDVIFPGKLITLSTLLSIITIPAIIALIALLGY